MQRTRSIHFVTVAALAMGFLSAASSFGQVVRYRIAFPRATYHEAEIEVEWDRLEEGPFDVTMSRASPGRYGLHEFAKNVYSVRAESGKGERLRVTRKNPHAWTVHGHDRKVVFRYTLFANRADGTFSQVNREHAHLNIPATFVWAKGYERRPVELDIEIPPDSGWRAATQLEAAGSPMAFRARNLDAFMDSPIELSAFDERVFPLRGGGREQSIRVVVHHAESGREVDTYAALARAVVEEEVAIFGEPPEFDFGEYRFIACYLPGVSGDGMEHRNSTILTSTRPLSTGVVRNMGTLAHEFIHAWNVERLRPRSLEPFDYTRANPSPDLWFAEGFTTYYTDLVLHRAGIIGLDRYGERIARVVEAVGYGTARRYISPVDASLQAPLVDGVGSRDPTNHANTFLSYYTYGSGVGLALDLTLRSRFPGRTLDEYLRTLWVRFGRDERPFRSEELERVLGEITGDTGFAREFFASYIEGREVVDYRRLLERAGLHLRDLGVGRPSLGRVSTKFESGGVVVRSMPRVDSALRAAGIGEGDRLVRVAGRDLANEQTLGDVLRSHRVGDRVAVEYSRKGTIRAAEIVLTTVPDLEIVPFESVERDVTPEIRSFRDSWLGPKARDRYELPDKRCAKCRRRYEFELEYCSRDGEALTPHALESLRIQSAGRDGTPAVTNP